MNRKLNSINVRYQLAMSVIFFPYIAGYKTYGCHGYRLAY